MQKFLLFLAGARRDILDQTPTERARFLRLGASILLSTAFSAAITGLALDLAYANVVLASVGGCIVGFFLLGVDSQLAATPATRSRRIFSAIPRVLIALLCGILFSTILTIGTLGPEINAQLAVIKQRAQAEFLQQQSASIYGREVKSLQNEAGNLSSVIQTGGSVTLNQAEDSTLANLEKQLNNAQATENNDFENWQCQLYGTAPNGHACTAGNGPSAQTYEARYNDARNTVDSLEGQINKREQQLTSSDNSARQARLAAAEQELPGIKLEIKKGQQILSSAAANFNAANNSDNGLLRKIQALNELTENNGSLRAYTLIVSFFIIILQCLPFLLRVVQRSGLYEQALETAQRREELRVQYRMRAAEGVLLEQVLDRESISAKRPPATKEPAAADGPADDITDEAEDMALRGMQDMRRGHPGPGRATD